MTEKPETRTVAAHLERPRLADGRFRRGPERGAVGLEGDGLELRELGRATARVLGLVELARLHGTREAAREERHDAFSPMAPMCRQKLQLKPARADFYQDPSGAWRGLFARLGHLRRLWWG